MVGHSQGLRARISVPEPLLRGDEIAFPSTFCHSQPPPLPVSRHWEGSASRSWDKVQEYLES